MKLNREEIEKVFEQNTNQGDALIDLYRIVFPDWDNIKQLDGYPTIGGNLWQYICQLFINFDKQYHQNVMPGGCWLNTGFSSNEAIIDNSVDFSKVKITYKEK